MKTKNILYLRTDILPEQIIAGGSIAHTVGVIEGFHQLGYHVVCASAVLKNQLEKLSLYRLHELSNPAIIRKLPGKINNLFSNIFFTVQALAALQDDSAACIYQRYSLLNASGVIIKKIKRIPLVLEYNGSELWIDQHWSHKRFIHLRPLIRFFEWLNLKYADYIVVVSQPLYDDLIARGIESRKIIVNPNGVDTDLYSPAKLVPERLLLRQELKIDNSYVFGFVGTFAPWHGIEVFESVIPAVIENNPKVHFLCIGDGPLKGRLEKKLLQHNITTQHVTFTGLVSHEKARAYLAACDAFVSPTQPNADGSRFFGSPTKLFEYLSMGRPVIASDLEQVKEIVSPSFMSDRIGSVSNEVGVVVPATHFQDWIKTLCAVASLPEQESDKMGINARHKAVQNYQWKRHVQCIIDFINI